MRHEYIAIPSVSGVGIRLCEKHRLVELNIKNIFLAARRTEPECLISLGLRYCRASITDVAVSPCILEKIGWKIHTDRDCVATRWAN